MKKIYIAGGAVILVIVLAIIFFVSGSGTENTNSANNAVPGKKELMPADVRVSVYDSNKEAATSTRVLISLLQKKGFQASAINDLPDIAAANQEITTLLFKDASEGALSLVVKNILKTSEYRKGKNEGIMEDVVISSWNYDDINWGDLEKDIQGNVTINPMDAEILVLNAGAPTGTAKFIGNFLQGKGYKNVNLDNSEEVTDTSGVIYYDKNYKEIAKTIRKTFVDSGYITISYQFRANQGKPIVIMFGSTATILSATTTPIVQ